MVEVEQGDAHPLSGRPEIEVVEAAHFAAFVLAALAEELPLRELEGPAIEQLLVFVRPLAAHFYLLLHVGHRQPLLLRKLLQLNIVEFIVVEQFAKDYVQICHLFLPFGSSLCPPYRTLCSRTLFL